jgi:zinc D-Ala-D-Ala carboxypeptidase
MKKNIIISLIFAMGIFFFENISSVAAANALLYNDNAYLLQDPYFEPLTKDFIPKDLVLFSDFGIKTVYNNNPLEKLGKKIMMKPLQQLFSVCEKETNMNIYIRSGYRSYGLQQSTYAKYGKTLSAFPGTSEHQIGTAFDIEVRNSVSKKFMNHSSPVYICMKKHAGDFGFIQSYSKNNPYGYESEPWHWRYIGKGAVDWLKRSNMSLSPWKVFDKEVVLKLQITDKEKQRIIKLKEGLYAWKGLEKKEKIKTMRSLIKKRIQISQR